MENFRRQFFTRSANIWSLFILKRNYAKWVYNVIGAVINTEREKKGGKRGKLPRQMDEGSRKSRDSDASEKGIDETIIVCTHNVRSRTRR